MMHATTIPPVGAIAAPPTIRRYRVLLFANRSEAVRYCLKVSDALESAALAGQADGDATLWLAAAEGRTRAVNVYACERAQTAARDAGLDAPMAGYAVEAELPLARCLVIGDSRLLQG